MELITLKKQLKSDDVHSVNLTSEKEKIRSLTTNIVSWALILDQKAETLVFDGPKEEETPVQTKVTHNSIKFRIVKVGQLLSIVSASTLNTAKWYLSKMSNPYLV